MARLIEATDSVVALGRLLALTLHEGDRLSDRVEVLCILVSINSPEPRAQLERFSRLYKEIVGTAFWDRAAQLYGTSRPLNWKASYRSRLTGRTNKGTGQDQLQYIIQSLLRSPGANTLSFSFYEPADHRRARAIAASMPCPIAGDFKYRQGKLHLSAFFRTHDVYRLGFPDLFFMRSLQREILAKIKRLAPSCFSNAEQGDLNLFFSRAFVLNKQRSNAKRLLDAIEHFQSCR